MDSDHKRIGRLEVHTKLAASRLNTIEDDLDCDMEGSLAQAIGELRDELGDLRAIIEEWVPRAFERAA